MIRIPPQVADMIVSKGFQAEILAHHRREIVVLFCDLRGFTSFAATSSRSAARRTAGGAGHNSSSTGAGQRRQGR